MHRWGAVRLVLSGLLTGGLIATGVTPVVARARPPHVTLTARVGAGTVQVGDPATLTARLSPARRGVTLVVQRWVSGRWVTYSRPRTDAHGRAQVRLSSSTAGSQRFRVRRTSPVPARRATSSPVTLTVTPAGRCAPRTPLVDTRATTAARCLAARLDRWQAARTMAAGQQLNVSNSAYAAPLTSLGSRAVPVVGFDLEELAQGQTYGFPVAPLDALVARAQAGAVLSASWHPPNPGTGGGYGDRSWSDLGSLLRPATPAAEAFWAGFEARMALLLQLQQAGVAVVFRPLHEANGSWFWWGHPAPSTYRSLWTAMQARAASLGVHNVLWAYSFNADTGSHITSPVTLLPAKVDLAGLDSYDPEVGAGSSADRLSTAGYAAVAAKVRRMTFTEVGPSDSPDGAWDPAVIAATARTLANPPLWAMLWFDDSTGRKQLASLTRGRTWLDGCRDGFCLVGP
ncbi:glycoside hydrolase family 26 protein [Nocardioides sp. URHA0020]|uniref:glycoside hydrolase family 26 protein n=1 Tax=Nocardioides sp. URHA0020 TaxID=1380392 RepID=UPI00048F0913|nr:glycosyl hydrolase [Nocardioides sp. URHA0020]